jgi:hypothetical protein
MTGERNKATLLPEPPETIGGFGRDRRRHVPAEVLPDGRYLIRTATAKRDFDILGVLAVNSDFWEFRPDLGGWAQRDAEGQYPKSEK